MKPLKITNPEVTQEKLLKQATLIPGAWAGIRVAALLLILRGWRSTAVANLFGLSRPTAVAWIRDANVRGAMGVEDRPRPGRPARMTPEAAQELEKALGKDPREFGLHRSRWDGVTVVEYLRKVLGISIKARQARNWLQRLGFVLKKPGYRLLQATSKGVPRFRRGLKKNLGPS